MKCKTQPLVQPLQDGQIWKMADSNLQITHVGKLLVNYRIYKDKFKGKATLLTSKLVVENYLKENKAVSAAHF